MKRLSVELMVDAKTHPSFSAWAEKATDLTWKERIRQNVMYGDEHFANESKEWILTVLTEEVGELAHAILEKDKENQLEEAVQIAAVSQALVELLLKQEMENSLDDADNLPFGKPIPCTSH